MQGTQENSKNDLPHIATAANAFRALNILASVTVSLYLAISIFGNVFLDIFDMFCLSCK